MRMQGMSKLNDAVVDAILASEVFSPGAGDEWKCLLFINNPTLELDSQLSDLEEATFDGYARKTAGVSPIGYAINPVDGNIEIRVKEPAGGFEFITTGPTNLPQTVYGAAFVDIDDNLLCAGKFDDPITLTAQTQVVDVSQPILEMLRQIFAE